MKTLKIAKTKLKLDFRYIVVLVSVCIKERKKTHISARENIKNRYAFVVAKREIAFSVLCIPKRGHMCMYG